MKVRFVCFVAVIIVLGPALAPAQGTGSLNVYLDGNELLTLCEYDPMTVGATPDEKILGLGCIYYIGGVADTFQALQLVEMIPKKVICIPAVVELGQLRLVVLKTLKANPESLHGSSASFVMRALYDAFPCESSNDSSPQ